MKYKEEIKDKMKGCPEGNDLDFKLEMLKLEVMESIRDEIINLRKAVISLKGF